MCIVICLQLDINQHTFLFRNLPPSPKAIITENPLPPPPRTSSSLAVNAISNDQLHKQKVFRHIHHNGPTSGILRWNDDYKKLKLL